MRNTNLTDLFDNLRSNNEYARTIEKGRAMYESKPFIVQNRTAYKISVGGRWLMGAVSIVSGVTASLTFNLSPYIVIPMGLILLGFVELLKNITVNDACRVWFTRKKISPAMPIALLLFGASAFMSVKGAMQAGELLKADGAGDIEATYSAKMDSINARFDKEKALANRVASQFRNDNLVVVSRGKRALRFNATSAYQSLLSKVDSVDAKRARAIYKMEADKRTRAIAHDDKAGNNIILLAFICGGIEFLILGLIAFGAFYLYRAYSEPQLIEDAKSYNLPLSQISKLVELSQLAGNKEGFAMPYAGLKANSNELASNIEEKRAIGFNSPSKGVATPSKDIATPDYVKAEHAKRAVKHSDYYEKYPALVDDLKAVNSGDKKATIKELATSHNVHEATIYRIKKAIFI